MARTRQLDLELGRLLKCNVMMIPTPTRGPAFPTLPHISPDMRHVTDLASADIFRAWALHTSSTVEVLCIHAGTYCMATTNRFDEKPPTPQ